MNDIDKYSSKTYFFFELLYRLIIINLLTLSLSIFIIPLLPAFTSAIMTIKSDSNRILREYFCNFKKVLIKAESIWITLILVLGLAFFSFWFYGRLTNNILSQIGLAIMIIVIFLVFLSLLHLPLILSNFFEYRAFDIFRISLFISCRYPLYTFILIGLTITMILALPVLPISLLFGCSLPLYFGIKLTKPIYEKNSGKT